MKTGTKDAIDNKPNSARAKAAYADMQRREAASNVLSDEHEAKMAANAKKILVQKNQDAASSLFKSNQKKEKAKGAKDKAIIDKIKAGSGSAKPAAKTADKTWKDVKSVAAAKAAGLKNYTGRDGKKKAAIDASEIKKGESMTQAFNRIQGKTARKPSSTTKSTTTKAPKKVGGLRKFLLGADGKFGGARGAIDFLPGKSRKKKEDKPVKKMGGGMMKSKMASKGGAMKKKGYAKGGAVRSKMASKGGASRKPTKPRGVGVAKRGFGKAMR